jgi:4-hydroxyproline epimerase
MANIQLPASIRIVDSHTAGEPTRCVLSGLPDLGSGTMAERLERLRLDHDHYRRAILCEPRGSDVLVGGCLLQPVDPASAAGVIFFNNAGYLGMCGHGTIGVAATLAHLGRIGVGSHAIETPVGTVRIELQSPNSVTIQNIPAFRHHAGVSLKVPGFGHLKGDVAWGGNWFFLCGDHGLALTLDRVDELTAFCGKIRRALAETGITGAHGAEIDHIELYAAPHDTRNNSRNFVLCPGNAYDRSPCGTGTSAKLACLAADGHLEPGRLWRQEGILGTVFAGSYQFEQPGIEPSHASEAAQVPPAHRAILPSITGSAYVTAESTLIFDAADPFRAGVPA